MAKRGAKSKYETLVKPHLEEINKKVRQGVTEASIADALGISVASLNNYKHQHPELAEALSKNRGADVLQDLINAGVEAAKGATIETEQRIYTLDEFGTPKLDKVIKTTVKQPPNQSLNKFYVMNFGREQGFTNDPLVHELKKQKQEFDEKLEKAKNWNLKL